MKSVFKVLPVFLLMLSCGSNSKIISEEDADFVIAFGSCNKEDKPQPLWNPILLNDPDLFIWGGDNIYSDTDDPDKMKADYHLQNQNLGYQKVLDKIPVMGTWDDHDYGLNDGGKEWHFKEESQQLFLDFFDVTHNSPRRNREGVYHAEVFETAKGSVKAIVLDTRYFRDALIRSEDANRRYEPSTGGTILGEDQWNWLAAELENSNADFNIIMSSIQILSVEHGYETWGNFPSEIERLKELIISSEAKNVILLSGDRHISEFSKIEVKGLNYPLIDFTSSGLNNNWSNFGGEPNRNRIGEVISEKSFGLLKFDFDKNKVEMEMRGGNNKLLQDYMVEFQ